LTIRAALVARRANALYARYVEIKLGHTRAPIAAYILATVVARQVRRAFATTLGTQRSHGLATAQKSIAQAELSFQLTVRLKGQILASQLPVVYVYIIIRNTSYTAFE
jgi:hypothetical protein